MPRPFYKARRSTAAKKKKSASVKPSEESKPAKGISRAEAKILLNEDSRESTPPKPSRQEKKQSRKSVSFGALKRDTVPDSPEFSVLVSPPRDPETAVVYTANHSPLPPRKRARETSKGDSDGAATLDKPRAKRTNRSDAVGKSSLADTEDLQKVKREYRDLLERYEDLKRIGIQEAETNFGEYKRNAQDRFKFSDNLVSQLKAQISTLKKSKTNAKEEILIQKQKEDIQSLKEQIEQLQAENRKLAVHKQDDLTLSLGLYKELAGLQVVSMEHEKDVTTWECEQNGRNGAFRYILRLEHDDPDSYHFEPMLDQADAALMQILPGYLTKAISFSKGDAGVFFWKVFNSLQQDV
ncbi:hypothetical protein K493DRAFT_344722 [Basidiobolus meristosporus CBS 931.73]|uniref:Monopolin complex subunit Csm1/Pcs1 C-terminal domain-containing protein n=1 Tax=Basidiobolus meristosporus CBS 931.73 TaxID=1314790 RepID=A0A1Y1Z6S2_9FUNG|nr:hypothetical protein K493DRAFT_344722 [Basidiobolus meristosporus CBS 931.73]|eukprot:ORY05953.1 hypothetical protein K493DRAFT_344722 [Basidiobolus meristosporus CBS 931.73]